MSDADLSVAPSVLVDIAKAGKRPRPVDVQAWSSKVATVTKILTQYADKESLQQLDEQRQKLGDILATLGLDEKGWDQLRMWLHSRCTLFGSQLSTVTGLPKALREALHLLATSEEIRHLASALHEHLLHLTPSDGEGQSAPEFDPDAGQPLEVEWFEGVEELNKLSKDKLWEHLGLPDKVIHFLTHVWTWMGTMIHGARKGALGLKIRVMARRSTCACFSLWVSQRCSRMLSQGNLFY
jgi:hypothetical protein